MKRSKPTNFSRNSNKNRSLPSASERATLTDLQRLMAGAVMRRLTPAEEMQKSWTDGRPTQQVVGEFIKPNDRLTSFERLEIYNRQYWNRILECFYGDYPGLQTLLGETKFRKLAIAYLDQCPSQCFTMRNLGRSLEEFLRAEPRHTKPIEQLALDMARLEWAHVEAFDAEACPVLTADDLLGLKSATVQLTLQPYLSLLELGFAVDQYLLSLKKEGDTLRSEASNAVTERRQQTVKKKNKPKRAKIFLAVHRMDDCVWYKRIEADEFKILSALRDGATLENACAATIDPEARSVEEWSALIRQWFQNWTSLGWFCRTGL
ncbi:MAG: DNA-binding domain-containing protein [Verrucomicrobiota bacterium]